MFLLGVVFANTVFADDPILAPASAASQKKELPYDSAKVLAYMEKYCNEGNDCPDGEYTPPNGTDCTHVICHGLLDGGVKVENIEAECKSHCCIRVKELAAAFFNATKKYSNVKQIELGDAKAGDFIFRTRSFGRKGHVMMLNGKPDNKGAKIFGHANNRCGERVEFDTDDCKIYRIE